MFLNSLRNVFYSIILKSYKYYILDSAEPERDGMPPKFVLSPNKTVEACITCSARMECKAIGDPKPDIKWYKEKLEVFSNDKFTVGTDDGGVCTLIVEDVTYEDEGTYKAVASNDFGIVFCTTKLIVKGKQRACFRKRDDRVSQSVGKL